MLDRLQIHQHLESLFVESFKSICILPRAAKPLIQSVKPIELKNILILEIIVDYFISIANSLVARTRKPLAALSKLQTCKI